MLSSFPTRLPALLLSLGVLTSACGTFDEPDRPPPTDRFYFPTALGLDPLGETLYVVSANFDRRYSSGTVIAVDLSELGLPALGSVGPEDPVLELTDLSVPDDGVVFIDSFGSDLTMTSAIAGVDRLFVTTRDRRSVVNTIDAVGGSLTCLDDAQDCSVASLALGEELDSEGNPFTPNPYGVAVAPPAEGVSPGAGAINAGQILVSHLTPMDLRTGACHRDAPGYLVQMNADTPGSVAGRIPIGPSGAYDVVVGRRFVFVSGCAPSANLLRLVDRESLRVISVGLEQRYAISEGRSLALTRDGSRLYMVGRSPDTLLVLSVSDPLAFTPSVRVIDAVDLPDGANQLAVIERASGGALVAVTSGEAGNLTLYDDTAGVVVAQLDDLGLQPHQMVVQSDGNAARLFVTLFGEGRVAVVDIPDLEAPSEARVVALLGEAQPCLESATCIP